MQSLLFYIPFAIALVSFVLVGIIGIWWQALVSEVLKRTPEHLTMTQRAFARSNIGMVKAINLAEQVDKALAKRMKLLMITLNIAALIFLGFGLLALLIGGVVFTQ